MASTALIDIISANPSDRSLLEQINELQDDVPFSGSGTIGPIHISSGPSARASGRHLDPATVERSRANLAHFLAKFANRDERLMEVTPSVRNRTSLTFSYSADVIAAVRLLLASNLVGSTKGRKWQPFGLDISALHRSSGEFGPSPGCRARRGLVSGCCVGGSDGRRQLRHGRPIRLDGGHCSPESTPSPRHTANDRRDDGIHTRGAIADRASAPGCGHPDRPVRTATPASPRC